MRIVRAITIILVVIIATTSLFLGSCAARTEPVNQPVVTAEPAEDSTVLLSDTEVDVTAASEKEKGTDHTDFLVGEFLDGQGGSIRFDGFGTFWMESYNGKVIDGSYTLVEYADRTILTLLVDQIFTEYTYTVTSGYGAFALIDANEEIIYFTPVCYD